MIQNTLLSKIKKAWALARASRGRGDVRRLPGKFHKLSVLVAKKAEKSTTENNLEQCAKCKKLIDYIFGPSDSIIIQKAGGPKLMQDEKYDIITQGPEKEKIGSPLTHKQVIIDTYIRATPKEEERLEQKVERIEETPLVEAEKKKIDNPETPPRVLGHIAEVNVIDDDRQRVLDNIHGKATKADGGDISPGISASLNKLDIEKYAKEKKTKNHNAKIPHTGISSTDKLNSFDAIAQRCLDAPASDIDGYLLREINKKCNTSSTSSSNTSMHKDQEAPKKSQQSMDNIGPNLKYREFKFSGSGNKIHPAFLENAEPQNISTYAGNNWQYKSDNTKLIDDENIVYTEEREPFQKIEVEDGDTEPRPQYDPLRPIIDPYDKRSIALDTDTFGYPTMNFEECKQRYDRTTKPAEAKHNVREPTLQSTRQYDLDLTKLSSDSDFDHYNCFENHCLPSRFEQKESCLSKHSITVKESKDLNSSQPDEIIIYSSETFRHLGLNHDNQSLGSKNKFKTMQSTETTRGQSTKYDNQEIEQSQHNSANTSIGIKQIPQNVIEREISSDWHPPRSETKQQNRGTMDPTTAAAVCSIPNVKEISNPVTTEQHSLDQLNPTVSPVKPNEIANNSTGETEKTVTRKFIESMPLISESEKVSLSVMLERVRLRNRIEFCRSVEAAQLDTVEGKCGKKKNPPCPPPAPKCPPTPPPKCTPVPPPCPRPCKPTCSPPCPPSTPTCPPSAPKCPSAKFTPISKEYIFFTMLLNHSNPNITFEYQLPTFTTAESDNTWPKADLTDAVIAKLKILGSKLWKCYRYFGILPTLGDGCSENFRLARSFEPWVPIPSFPIEKKEKKKAQSYPKDGCKMLPPPPLENPCAKPSDPCLGFPKRSNFSKANLNYF